MSAAASQIKPSMIRVSRMVKQRIETKAQGHDQYSAAQLANSLLIRGLDQLDSGAIEIVETQAEPDDRYLFLASFGVFPE